MNENQPIHPELSPRPEDDRLPIASPEAITPIDIEPTPAMEVPAEATSNAAEVSEAVSEGSEDSDPTEAAAPVDPIDPIDPADPSLPTQEPPPAPKKKRNGLKITLLVCLCVILSTGMGIAGGVIGALATHTYLDRTPALNASVVTETVVKVNNAEIETTAVMQASANAVRSVVVIDTFQSKDTAAEGKKLGAGSGVIWTADGYIVTCNHVVEDAPLIRVTLADGTAYYADVVGTDSRTDLAVLKITTSTKLPAVTVRGSELVLGETVIAIGNPLGVLSNTVSEGILSCLARSIKVEGQSMSLIQIDASVNHGNSGGGLFDTNGSLIGIVNAKSTGESVEGIGFAIPINTVMEISNQLIEFGYVQGRPRLGITVVTVTESNSSYVFEEGYYPELKEYATVTSKDFWGRERTEVVPGVYIYDLTLIAGYVKNSPELQFGDRLLYVGSTEITKNADVLTAIASYNAGDEIQITIQRNHKSTIVVTLIIGQQGAK